MSATVLYGELGLETSKNSPSFQPDTTASLSPSQNEISSSMLIGNKFLLFTVAGLIGGALGSLGSEFIMSHEEASSAGFMSLVFRTGVWGCCWGIGITLALLGVCEVYARRSAFSVWVAINGLWRGALCGFVSGAVAQAVFSLPVKEAWLRYWIFKPVCWGIAGLLLGLLLSFSIPNLGKIKGAIAGMVGGFIGGGTFVCLNFLLLMFNSCGTMAGGFLRMVGIGIIGAAVGLVVTVAEAVFRSAYVEIFWGTNEKTIVNLGPEPVWFGGGRSQVFVKGLPERSAGLVMQAGTIVFMESNGSRRTLGDGQSMTVGHVRIVVHAKK